MEIGAFTDSTPEANCNAEGQGAPFDIAQLSTDPGATFVAPVSGVITSWSTFAADGPGQTMNMKLAGLFESEYLIRRHDGPRALAPGQLNTFRTLLPVERGDMITLSPGAAPTACFLFSERPGDTVTFGGNIDTPDGQRWQPGRDIEEAVLNVAVTILPPPRIAAIGASQGSVAGGTPVVVTGANFAEVRSVTFSGVPALSYSVASEGQLTAVAPPNTALTSRTIEVTTAAGKANAPQTFNYIGCAVPSLKRGTLKEAKRDLPPAGCALGKVKRLKKASLKKGKVTRQVPAAGAILPPGAQVSVTIKGGAPKKHRKKHR